MDLTRIRKNIDLDSMIITLLAKRADMVTAAGQLTPRTRVDTRNRRVQEKDEQCVCDPKRVNQVLRNVHEKAAGKGLDPAVAEEVYRTIIRCFVSKELKEFESRSIPGRGRQCR